MSNKDVEKCHTVIMIHGQCKNEWCYASGICALCKKCDNCCQCAYLPCQECICDACKEQMSNDNENEQIAKLLKERDEARREAYRHWLLFQYASADLRGERAECKLLSRIYKDMFNSPPNAIMEPPYGFNAEEHNEE